jgi:GH35 family endo-1,4-beta-xylanase
VNHEPHHTTEAARAKDPDALLILSAYDPYKDGLPAEIQQKQVEQYVEIFKLFDQNSDIIARVSFWNLHDGHSWLNDFPWQRVSHPLLFDRDRRPKAVFDAVFATLQAPRSARSPARAPRSGFSDRP